MSALVWSYVSSAVMGLLVGFWATWWSGRRARRRERRHEIRIRLVDDGTGVDWLNVTCEQLNVIRRYGGQDDPPWQTLETIYTQGGLPVRLQVAPAHLD